MKNHTNRPTMCRELSERQDEAERLRRIEPKLYSLDGRNGPVWFIDVVGWVRPLTTGHAEALMEKGVQVRTEEK